MDELGGKQERCILDRIQKMHRTQSSSIISTTTYIWDLLQNTIDQLNAIKSIRYECHEVKLTHATRSGCR